MSIQSEINRISGAVSAAYTAVEEKGGTATSTKIDDLADAIGTISGGGPSSYGTATVADYAITWESQESWLVVEDSGLFSELVVKASRLSMLQGGSSWEPIFNPYVKGFYLNSINCSGNTGVNTSTLMNQYFETHPSAEEMPIFYSEDGINWKFDYISGGETLTDEIGDTTAFNAAFDLDYSTYGANATITVQQHVIELGGGGMEEGTPTFIHEDELANYGISISTWPDGVDAPNVNGTTNYTGEYEVTLTTPQEFADACMIKSMGSVYLESYWRLYKIGGYYVSDPSSVRNIESPLL